MTGRDARLFVLFLAAPALLFFFPFLAGKTHFIGDVFRSFHPWLSHAAQELQAGRLPLWDPYTACGQPFLANPQTLIFLPWAQLFWTFPFTAAWPAFLFLNQALLFAGAYALARWWLGRRGPALLAALALAWGGFVVVLWEFPSAGATLASAPFFLLFSLSGAWPWLVPCTAMLLWGGYPQVAFYVLLWGAAATLVWRRRALPFWAAAVGAGLCVALPQFLSSWEVSVQSTRAAIGEAEARAYLLNPAFLAKFLMPAIFDKAGPPYALTAFGAGFWQVQRNWLNTFFLGTAPFLLAWIGAAEGRRRKGTIFFACSAVLAVALSMGVEPIFTLVRRSVPGFRYMTHFSNFMAVAVMALSLLAAAGLAAVERRRRLLAGIGAAAAVLCLAVAILPGARSALLRALLDIESLTPAQHRHAALAGWKGLAGLALAGVALALPARPRTLALAALSVGELWLFGRDLHPLVDASFYRQPLPLARRLQGSPHRFMIAPDAMRQAPPMDGDTLQEGYQSLRQVLRPNAHLPFRVRAAWGYEVFPLARFAEFRRTLGDGFPAGPQVRFLGGGEILSMSPLPPPARLAAGRPNGLLYENPEARPPLSRVPRAKVLPGSRERLAYLSGAWDPSREVVLEAGPAVDGTGSPSQVDGKFFPGRVEAAGGPGGGWLVLAETFHPGWEVYVNGKQGRLLRANHAFQTVQLPEGDWKAVFLYRPPLFRAGTWAAAGALLLLGCALGRLCYNKKPVFPPR